MNPSRHHNAEKIIASFVVIMAVVIVSLGANGLKKLKANDGAAATMSTATSTAPATNTTSSAGSTTAPAASSSSNSFKDGTYQASSDYFTPGGQEGINVSLTVQNGTVTASTVSHQSNNRESEAYQYEFSQGYKQYVVGKKLSDINLFAVSGASLTTQGFEDALAQIQTKAQA